MPFKFLADYPFSGRLNPGGLREAAGLYRRTRVSHIDMDLIVMPDQLTTSAMSNARVRTPQK